MAKNTVANIGVDLTAKIAGFEANMNKATKKLSSSQAKMNKSLKRIEGGFAALGKKIAAFAGIAGAGLALRSLNNLSEKAIDFGDSLAKTADKLGIDIEVLQEFRFAAERAGIAQTTLDTAVQRFIRRSAEAAQGTGEAKAALKELGIELKDSDGNLRPVEQLLSDVADGFKKLENPADRVRLAFKLFDTEGVSLVNLLKDGSVNLEAMKNRARELGAVLSEDSARGAEVAKDRLTDLSAELEGKLITAVLNNIDGFIQFKELMNDISIAAVTMSAKIGNLSGALDGFFDETFSRFVSPDRLSATGLRAAIRAQENTLDELIGIRGQGSPRPARLETLDKQIKNTALKLVDLKRRLDALSPKETGGTAPVIFAGGDAGGGSETFSSFSGISAPSLAPMKKQAEELTEQIDELSQATIDWRLASEDAARGIADAFADAIVFGDKLGQSLKRLAQQLASRLLSDFLFKSISTSIPFLGGKAGGGRIQPGIPTLVGERGPEIIVPQRAATVMNNADSRGLGGQSVVVNQTIAPNFAGNAATLDDLRLMGQIAKQAAIEGTMQALRRPKFA